MSDGVTDARPVPLTRAVQDLIRQVAQDSVMEPRGERTILVDGEEWIARVAGGGVAGAGEAGGAYFVVVRFERVAGEGAGGRGGEAREALLPRGRFEYLFEEELLALFRSAKTVKG